MSIRAAIIGFGRNGSTMHAGPLSTNPDFTLAAVCDIDPARRDLAAGKHGCPVYEDYREMLRQETLDLAVIVTRNDQHAAMACDCLRAGLDVLVTKPWAVNPDEARRMIAAARSAGKKLLPWLPARWGCELRRLRKLVAAGDLGRVFLVRRTVTSFGTRCDWQTERKFGGGYVLNWGPHIVDPPVLLVNGKVKSVFARLKQVINPGDVEDLFLAVLTLEDGTVVQAEYTIGVEPFPAWVVQGDRGTATLNGRKLRVVRQTPARPADPTKFSTMQAAPAEVLEATVEGAVYGDENEIYRDIAAALKGEGEYAVTPDDALQLTRVLDAIKVSSAENRVVML